MLLESHRKALGLESIHYANKPVCYPALSLILSLLMWLACVSWLSCIKTTCHQIIESPSGGPDDHILKSI